MQKDLKTLAIRIHENAVSKGFWDEVNIERAILLIISELYEALEAYRKGNKYKNQKYKNDLEFEMYVKDTVQDELADVVIRLLDLWAYLGRFEVFERKLYQLSNIEQKSLYGDFYQINQELLKLFSMNNWERSHYIPEAVVSVYKLFERMGYKDLDWHIEAKMKYNAGRPRLHGKEF